MKVLCVQGSLGRPSRTAAVASIVAELLRLAEAQVDMVDLREISLPVPDPRFHKDPEGHPDPTVRAIAVTAGQADAFVLATPVYHNSYSGVLKCLLDHLAIEQFADKPVALCGNTGRNGSVQPVDHLRLVVRGLHAVAIPYQIVSRSSDFEAEGERLRLVSQDLPLRLRLMTEQLIQYAKALRLVRESPADRIHGLDRVDAIDRFGGIERVNSHLSAAPGAGG